MRYLSFSMNFHAKPTFSNDLFIRAYSSSSFGLAMLILWGIPSPKLQIKFHFFMYLCSGLNYNQALKLSTHPLMHWPINKKDHVKIIFACQQLKDLHQFYHTKSEERKNVLSFFTIYVPRHHELNYYSNACFFSNSLQYKLYYTT